MKTVLIALALAAGAPQQLTVDELKRAYLACNRGALDDRLGTAGIIRCSLIYEELKRRAFGGDFGKLLVWSRSQKL